MQVDIPDTVYHEAEVDRVSRLIDNATLVRLMYERNITPEEYKNKYGMYYALDESIMSRQDREKHVSEIYN